MDKRIKLTAKQLRLVKRFSELISKMKEEQIGIVSFEYSRDLWFYNKSKVISTDSGWGVGDMCDDWYVRNRKVWITPDYDEIEDSFVDLPVDITVDKDEEWFSLAVEASTKAELEEVEKLEQSQKEFKRKQLQAVIAGCKSEKQKFQKKMEEAMNSEGLPQKGKDYQKRLFTKLIKENDEKIAEAQKELDEL